MSIKLKGLGLVIIWVLSLSVMAVISASAETGGHFTIEAEVVTVKGENVAGEPANISLFGGDLVTCKDATYSSSIVSGTKTVTEITITPFYDECNFESIDALATVDMKGCDYLFTIRKTEPEKKDNTIHLVCPGKGPHITVDGPFGNCVFEITPNQTPTGGVVYETGGTGKTHDITMNFTASGFHAVITEPKPPTIFRCLTTAETSTSNQLLGKVTLRAFNAAGEQVGITATGS